MSGPTAGVLLPYEPDEGDFEEIRHVVSLLDARATGPEFFHVLNTAPIGFATLSAEGGRPFSLAVAEPAMPPGELALLREAFGFVPVAELEMAAHANHNVDHRILGELAAFGAKHFGGIVDFGGQLDLSGEVLPGRFVPIPYRVSAGQISVYHAGDVEFLLAWLRSPGFHMVK
jgi:hypothetical protein